MKNKNTISFWFVIIGGLNWLLVGLFNWDIGAVFGGQGALISKIIYILIGISAIYLISKHKDCCMKGDKCCPKDESTKEPEPEPEVKEDSTPSFNSEAVPESESEV